MLSRYLAAFALPFLLLLGRPASADLLVVDGGLQQVLRYNGSTGEFLDVFVSPGTGGLSVGFGLTFGPDGNLYVRGALDTTAAVLRYNGTTGAFIGIFASGGRLVGGQSLTFGPDGNLYVSNTSGGGTPDPDEVLRYNGSTGEFIDAFVPAGSGGLNNPDGLTFGPDGNLYVNSLVRGQVLRYNGSTGEFIDAFVPAVNNGQDIPFGLAFGPDGNLYVSGSNTSQILRYDGGTGQFLGAFVTAGSGGLGTPIDLTFGPDGNLYVSSFSTDQVLRYDGITGAFIDTFASGGGLDVPLSLVFTPVTVVPEPPSLTLLGLGALGLAGYSWRRRKLSSTRSVRQPRAGRSWRPSEGTRRSA